MESGNHIFLLAYLSLSGFWRCCLSLCAASGSTVTAGETYALCEVRQLGSLKVRRQLSGGVVVGRVTNISLSGEYYEPLVEMEISRIMTILRDK